MGRWGDRLRLFSVNNPVVTGSGYEYQYVEGLGKIVDRAVDLISTEPRTVNEKAALKNRTDVLLALGSRINALIQPGGFAEAKDQALIAQMGAVMAGLFVDAYDPRGTKAGIFKGYENWAWAWLAQQLVTDSLKPTSPISVRVQVFQATLLEVVTEVFSTKGITMTAAQQQAVTAAVKELAKTYAWLKPTAEASVPTDETDYGFLDLLWRLQIPGADGKFKGASVVQADLGKAVTALGHLLEGVNDPARAIQFLNGLVQAEADVTSLKGSVKDAQFLRENVQFGFEVSKIGMTTSTTSADEAASSFLNTLLKDGNTKQAQAGVGQFFAGLNTTQERVKALEFADRLMDAAQLTTIGDQKKDASFISHLVGLGGTYAALYPFSNYSAPEATGQERALDSFLTIVWQAQSQQDLQNGAVKMNEFSTKEILEYEQQTLKEMMRIPALKEQLKNLDFFNSIFISSRYFATGEETNDLTALLAATEANASAGDAPIANKSLDTSSDTAVKSLKASANGKYPGRDQDYWKNSLSPATQAYSDFYLFFIKPLNLEWKQTGPVSYTDLTRRNKS